MKKWAILAVLVSAFAFTAAAQGKTDCKETYRQFEVKMKAAAYDDASALLAALRKTCPKFSSDTYILGEKLLKNKIETTRKQADRLALIGDLLALYAEHDKYFPANTNAGAVKRAMLQKENKLATDDEVFNSLNAAFARNSTLFTDPNALETYFLLYSKEYGAGKGITQEQFIDKYTKIAGQAENAKSGLEARRADLLQKQQTLPLDESEKQFLASADAEIEIFGGVSENISLLALKQFSCENLEQYYSKNIETIKGNAAALKTATSVLFGAGCHTSPTLQKSAEALYAIKHTPESALVMGTLAQRKNDIAGAIVYFDEAAKLESNPSKQSYMYSRIAALLLNSDKTEAKKYALKAAQANPGSGRPYLFLAEMYGTAAKDCGLNELDAKALNWLAIETLKKAETAQPGFKATVAKMAENYTKKAPNKDDLKKAGKKKGDTITFGCWINETIVIPAL